MPRRGASGASGKKRYCITLDSLVGKAHGGVQDHQLIEVGRFLNFAYFYRANATLIITTGRELTALSESELGDVVNQFNNYISSRLARGRRSSSKGGGGIGLSINDFLTCDTNLSSDELIEMKEHLKTSSSPHSYRTSEVYFTTAAIKKLAEASRLFRVRVGDSYLFVVIDVPRSILSRDKLGELNREFIGLASDLGFTSAYVLAASLLVRYLGGNCGSARARLVLMREKYFTSLPLQAENLCGKRHFAGFYVDLLRGKSDLVEAVASALLTYVQTGRASVLYDIVRNMTQTKRLTQAEADALRRLVEHEAGY